VNCLGAPRLREEKKGWRDFGIFCKGRIIGKKKSATHCGIKVEGRKNPKSTTSEGGPVVSETKKKTITGEEKVSDILEKGARQSRRRLRRKEIRAEGKKGRGGRSEKESLRKGGKKNVRFRVEKKRNLCPSKKRT